MLQQSTPMRPGIIDVCFLAGIVQRKGAIMGGHAADRARFVRVPIAGRGGHSLAGGLFRLLGMHFASVCLFIRSVIGL